MSTLIAVAGKGGVGKTTFASLIVKYLASRGWDEAHTRRRRRFQQQPGHRARHQN